MPNRILKESITTSCEVDNLTAEEERLFYRLIVVCDDFGRMDGRLPIIRAKCFPLKLDKIKDKDVSGWLQSLARYDLVTLYEVDSKPFIQMTTWDKHQQKRAKHSKFPAPDEGMISDDINCNQLQDDVPENREYENTRNEKRECDQLFENVWKLYPEKKGKSQISDTKKKELFKHGFDIIARCIDRYKDSVAHKRRNGFPNLQYQHGSTFFNGGYIDYLDENYQQQQNEPEPKEQLLAPYHQKRRRDNDPS